MFRGNLQHFDLNYPFKGINTNALNDAESAHFIQNIMTADNNSGKLRYGTNLVSQIAFDEDRPFRDQLAIMPFLTANGVTEKLVYQTYLQRALFLNVPDITINQNLTNIGYSDLVIDLTNYTADEIKYLLKIFFDNVGVFIKQDGITTHVDDFADISNFSLTYNVDNVPIAMNFTLPFPVAFFDTDPDDAGRPSFKILVERAGVYRLKADNTFEMLIDDLDPNVIISYVNYRQKLIIANGVDHVKVYDGNTIVDLKGEVSAPKTGNIAINIAAKTVALNIENNLLPELTANLFVNDVITLLHNNTRTNVTIAGILVTPPSAPSTLANVVYTLVETPPAAASALLYKKYVPKFSFVYVAHDMLWALAEGRPYQDKFRAPELAMRFYYAAKKQSVDGWFNQRNNQVDYYDLGDRNPTDFLSDNLEVITSFEGKMLFIGRETTQVWNGIDPRTENNGQVNVRDFNWERTLKVGIVQRSLYVEVPNNLIFLSKYGIISLNANNLFQKLEVSYSFSEPISHHLKNQLAFVESERDYRSMKAFLYPYGRFLGFKLSYSCFVYQLNTQGAWVVFSENFADATCFLYDPVSKDLFLGLKGGVITAYADKTTNQSYEDYGKGKISWIINYNWLFPPTTWVNSKLFLGAKTYKSLTVDVRLFTDFDEATSSNHEIVIEQKGVAYDVTPFNTKTYPYAVTAISHEMIKFRSDCFMLILSGLSNDAFTLSKVYFTGGTIEGGANAA